LKRFIRREYSADKWVVFDFDGTIAETNHHLVAFYNEHIYTHFKCRKMENGDIDKLRDLNIMEKLKYLQIPMFELPSLIRRCRKKFRTSLVDLPMVEGLKEQLSSLKSQGYKLAIISSNRKKNIVHYLGFHGIEEFELVCCDKGRSLFVKHKTIKKFLKDQRLYHEQMVYVGDEGRDVLACRRVRVPVIAVAWGWDSHRRLAQVSQEGTVIDSPSELIAKVNELLPL